MVDVYNPRAWAERTAEDSLARGAWYVWWSEEPGVRAIVATFGLPPGGHPSPSANEESAKKVAKYINDAYALGRLDTATDEENLRSGKTLHV